MTPESCDNPPTIQPGSPSSAGLYAPSPVYLTGEEWLRVTAYSSTPGLVVAIRGRILRPDNVPVPIDERNTPAGNRVANVSRHPLSEGWLLGLQIVEANAALVFGQLYVVVELVRGAGASAQPVQALAFGYVTGRTPLIWPGGLNILGLDGPGNLRSITGTTPGAGAEISETVPTGARWELISFRAQLTTSGSVANRVPVLLVDDGSNIYAHSETPSTVPASNARLLAWGTGQAQQPNVNSSTQFASLPGRLLLGAGHRLRTTTAAIQAADQYGLVQYLVREWFTGE